MQYKELVTDEQAFVSSREQCWRLFLPDRRLPNQVFKRRFAHYCAFEHGQIFRKDFADVLATLANASGDKTINYMTIEPDAVDYYREHCGFYGLATIPAAAIADRYISIMYRDGSADSFRARGGDVGVMWGDSMKWGMFCDRKSWELCVLGLEVPLDEPTRQTLGCMDASSVAMYISNLYRNRDRAGSEFSDELALHYPGLQ